MRLSLDVFEVVGVMACASLFSVCIIAQPAAPTLDQIRNGTVSGIYEKPVTLKDGVYEGAAYAAGGSSRPRLVLMTELVAHGDLDGAPGDEAAVLLSQTTGGSGEVIHIAAFGSRGAAPVQLGAARVGDRTKIRSVRIADGTIVLDVVEAGPKDAMCCPTQLAQKTYAVRNGTLKPVSSTVTGRLSVGILAGSAWTLVSMDRNPLPGGAAPPTITFDEAGVSGFGGCNRYRGQVMETAPGEVKLGPLVSTRMACAQPSMDVEDRFLASLGSATRYTFVSGRLVILSAAAGTPSRELAFVRASAR